MPSLFDNRKLTELTIGMFGSLCCYIGHNLLYERLVMSQYINSENSQKEFFNSWTGLLLLQRGIALLLIQVIAKFTAKKQDQTKIPINHSFGCGLLMLISSVLFTRGLYEISYRYAFSLKTLSFFGASFFALIFSPLSNKSSNPRPIHTVMSLLLSGGIVLFWIYDPQITYYVPIQWKVFWSIMVCISAGVDGILGIWQKFIIQTENTLTGLQLLRDLTRWTVAGIVILVVLMGDLPYAIGFMAKHKLFALEMVALGILYALAQIFTYRTVKTMALNVPGYLQSTKNILAVQMSYSLTIHKYYVEQVIGLLLSWISIVVQAFLFIKKENIPKKSLSKPYEMNQMTQEEIQL